MARVDPRNRAHFWHEPTIAGMSLLHADFTAHDYAPHRHDGLVIAITEAGGSEFTSRGKTGEAQIGSLLVFNADEPHSGRMGRSRRWRYRSLYLTETAIGALNRGLGADRLPYFTNNMFADPDLVTGFHALHRVLEAGGDPLRQDALRQDELMVESFGSLFRRHGGNTRGIAVTTRAPTALDRVQTLMQERYAEKLGLDEMAVEAGLTAFQLIGLFKRETGMTPHATLIQIRLRAAIADLDAGVSLAEAALAAGFYDQSALTRHFKRSFGFTPLQYVKAAAG